MFSQFLVIALLYTITYAEGMGNIPPIKDVAPIEEAAPPDRFPFMLLEPSQDKEDLYIHYSRTQPSKGQTDLMKRRLTLSAVKAALKKKKAPTEAIDVVEGHEGWKVVVDEAPETAYKSAKYDPTSHWKGCKNDDKIWMCVNPEIVNLINNVCTEQLDVQPSIILLPFHNIVYIQYPEIGRYRALIRLKKMEQPTPKVSSAIRGIPIDITPTITAFDKATSKNDSDFDLPTLNQFRSTHWTYQNTGMRFEELNQEVVIEAFRRLEITELPNVHHGAHSWKCAASRGRF
ncbi:hypothetical protein PTTG_29121 [Puccinia triticina 1-1 BBBD Race 1]|uniref:Uncharacterized protein n=1 Tax=Puccinia triticina (isolate 1-1 / race 1 (BBBD)) TaxID=630390 RepID=A0A180G6G9_PUCT1|nr:hypothetical protein PTTG_29121 [Puccinia triticina 1-1 BBBD Race 1]